MTKFFVISLIFFLILSTAFIKNSTKRIDDEIFSIKENIRILENEFGNLKLEYFFLSNGERLIDFQSRLFNETLKVKSRDKIETISINE